MYLQAVAAEITDQVRLLDGLVRYEFGGNAELMGAWASARNVVRPFRSRSASPAAGEGGAQTTGPAVPGPAGVQPAAWRKPRQGSPAGGGAGGGRSPATPLR